MRPIGNITVGNHRSGVSSSAEGWAFREFEQRLTRDGYVIVERSWPRPTHHTLAGCGVGHDDADFAEIGRSMAAWYENGGDPDGRWWETTDRFYSAGVKYYGCQDRSPKVGAA